VAVIESFCKSIGTTELQAFAEAAIYVQFQTVVRTDAFGEPMGRVPNGVVCQWRVGRIINRPNGITCRARRRWADRWGREIRVHGKQSVVTVRSDVADAQRRIRKYFAFNF